jgi:predicted TIM-barrel fold metal-dependent hydrolase
MATAREGTRRANVGPAAAAVKIVDSDVHPLPRSVEELRSYLRDPWSKVPDNLLASDPLLLYLATGQPYRRDAVPAAGGPAGSDPALAEKQLLGDAGVDHAILLPLVRTFPNQELEAAMCSAMNDWLDATWLTEYNDSGSYWGSINVAAGEPALAVAEIERWAGNPRMVQIRFNAYAGELYGHPSYDPIYKTAQRHDLPIAIHFSKGTGTSLLTPAGYVSTYFEHHALYPVTYGAHLVSLVFGGTFERFPRLKYVFVEGGFCWVAPLLWRMDRLWTEQRSELPDVRRPPSEYVREHVRFTSQPIEEPEDKRSLAHALDWAHAEEILLYSSDYPHWDYDDPTFVVRQLPRDLRRRVFADNALEFYGLPRERAVPRR